MLESVFAFLFKYTPSLFGQGDVRFSPSGWSLVGLVVVAAAVVLAVITSRRGGGRTSPRDRVALLALRVALLALVLACLLRPVLVLKVAVPQQNFLGILLDDSLSMRLDDGTEARSAVLQRLFGSEASLRQALADRFSLRSFGFSSSASRVAAVTDLTFEGTRTRLGESLRRAEEELAGLPVAALVLVTDGADTTDAPLDEALLSLKADGVPVFTVGLGRDRIDQDIEVSRVSAPRRVLRGTALVVDVVIVQQGYEGRSVPVNVEDEGRILNTQSVTLGANGEPTTVRVRFTAEEAGPRVLRFRVPPQDGEAITQNNGRDVLIDVDDRRERILYFEGEPRFEVKFIRRAVSADANLQLVVLQRTADNKYLRLEVDEGEELASGFPRTREDLFVYRGLMLGSIEAAAFTGDQLRMIAEFVDRRGGGLLVLGGRRSLGEGGFAGTPLADVLPVEIERPPSGDGPPEVVRLTVEPTRAGALNAVTQLAPTEEDSMQRWRTLPQVTSVNRVSVAKAGATVLLTGRDQAEVEHIVLAHQRYGRGKALVFGVQDSWLWQLHASMPVEDPTHENLWRQLLRWTVEAVPDPVSVLPGRDQVEPGERVTLSATVLDPAYVEVNNARVVAQVTTPAGETIEIPLHWTGERNGEYEGTFDSSAPGLYEIRSEATRDDKSLGTTTTHLRVAPSDAEYFNATMRTPLLERIAGETGGRFYTPDNAAQLIEDVKYTGRGVTTIEERDLWDMPVVLALLVGLLGAEWVFRRSRGLA